MFRLNKKPLSGKQDTIIYVSCIIIYYVLLAVHLGIIFVNNQLDAQFFSCVFISILYMFRAAM